MFVELSKWAEEKLDWLGHSKATTSEDAIRKVLLEKVGDKLNDETMFDAECATGCKS